MAVALDRPELIIVSVKPVGRVAPAADSLNTSVKPIVSANTTSPRRALDVPTPFGRPMSLALSTILNKRRIDLANGFARQGDLKP